MKYFPDRNKEEFEVLFSNVKYVKRPNEESKPNQENGDTKTWLGLAEKLLEEVPDYSYNFEKIVDNFYSQVEAPEKSKTRSKDKEPNWQQIYLYLTRLFTGEPLPVLGQIESGIILMQFEDLLSCFDSMETSDQRQLCLTKYNLLQGLSDELGDPELRQRAVNTALDLNVLRTPAMPSQQNDLQTPPSRKRRQTLSQSFVGSNPTTPSEKSSQIVAIPSLKPKQLEQLYSVNPFCIPIPMLNPKQKPAEQL